MRRFLAVLASSTLLLACGGSGDDPDPTATVAPTPQPTAATAVAAQPADAAGRVTTFQFDPPMLTVPVGTTVTWTNLDQAPHTATATDGAFDSGNLNRGQSFSFTFVEAGSFAYVCRYHPNMKGTIVVA